MPPKPPAKDPTNILTRRIVVDGAMLQDDALVLMIVLDGVLIDKCNPEESEDVGNMEHL